MKLHIYNVLDLSDRDPRLEEIMKRCPFEFYRHGRPLDVEAQTWDYKSILVLPYNVQQTMTEIVVPADLVVNPRIISGAEDPITFSFSVDGIIFKVFTQSPYRHPDEKRDAFPFVSIREVSSHQGVIYRQPPLR